MRPIPHNDTADREELSEGTRLTQPDRHETDDDEDWLDVQEF